MNIDYFSSSDCCISDTRKSIVIKEKKCQITFLNRHEKKIFQIRVDDCLIKEGIKCDYLVLVPENKRAFFIELKGQDFLHAIRQINTSIDQLIPQLYSTEINARIVLTKVNTPNLMNNPLILKFEKRIKKLNGCLIKGTIKLFEKI